MRVKPAIRLLLSACVLLGLVMLPALASADMLSLKDGRFISDREIDRIEGGYTVHYVNGKLFVPDKMVADFFESGDDGAFVPKSDEEKAKVEKGLLPWRGGWIKKSRRDKLMKRELVAQSERLKQQKERRKWRNREIVKTKLFNFEHTLPDDLFAEFRSLFETYYKVFAKEWKIRPSKDFGKVTINIYHDEEYYQQVSGAPSGVVGYYVPAQRDLHFFYDRDRHDFTVDVMFHEGNHMLTHMINERMWYPSWLGEGMAEYYGASDWDARTKTMTIGGIQSARLCVLWNQVEEREKKGKDRAWYGLEELIKNQRIGAIGYSWAWSFCHFLLSSEKYQKGFKKFFKAIGTDRKARKVAYGPFITVPPDEQIRLLLKHLKVKELHTLEKEWHQYIRKELALDLVELDWAGAGWIMSLYGERKKAAEFFEKAVSEGEQSGYVYYSYAKLLFDQNERDRASTFVQKAIEADPFHARAWLLKGLCHIRQGKDKRKEGMRMIDLAMELDPDDSHIWLAKAFEEDEVKDGE